jgi:hypothetical protein
MNKAAPSDPKEDFGDLASDPFNPKSVKDGFALIMLPATLYMGLFWTPWGPWLMLLGGGVIMTMMAALIQCVIVYITSFMVVVFLGILGPIVIPMVLFHTFREGFMHWVQMMFAYMIQPAIVLAYITFMMFVIDVSLFGRAPVSQADLDAATAQIAAIGADTSLTPQQVQNQVNTITKANEFPKEGSLMWFYNKVATDPKENFVDEDRFTVTAQTQSKNKSKGGDNTTATSGNEKGAFSFTRYYFQPGGLNSSKLNQTEGYRLVQAVLQALLLFYLTYTFLPNIMNFGAQLAGLEATSKMVALNAYNQMADKVQRSMRGG